MGNFGEATLRAVALGTYEAYMASQIAGQKEDHAMWTLQDAKNRFSAVVDAALKGAPQEVTRRGKPAVVVLSVEQYRMLLERTGRQRESFADHLLAFPGPEVERLHARPREAEF